MFKQPCICSRTLWQMAVWDKKIKWKEILMVSSQIMQAHVYPKGAGERFPQGLVGFGAKGKEVFTGGNVLDQ